MQKLYVKKIGTGRVNLILIHGWGYNSNIWFKINQILNKNFLIHLVDLPGYGNNNNIQSANIYDTIDILYYNLPTNAIWVGWSIGGLIISKLAIIYPNCIAGIINITSSPCFIKKPQWPGITIKKLNDLYQNMQKNYFNSINNFLKLQIKDNLYLKKYEKKTLNKIIYKHFPPSYITIKNNMKIIQETDIREDINKIKIPIMYIFGDIDPIIPNNIKNILITKFNKKSFIIKNCGHMPFLSHYHILCKYILFFKKNIFLFK
ncbi:Pimeloyl-[acyl-carrier protein] methyl ester esterase [Buchnera aphidicola (Thelaxes suberi)]|uniref:alpha/beta fold hydrolase n=1 Tax=Buchnera aphidicola TaxID=9 RepID=UPI003464D69C